MTRSASIIVLGVCLIAAAASIHPAAARQDTGQEVVRNGSFDLDVTGWAVTGTGSGVDPAGPSMALEAIMENQAMLYQAVYLPSAITAATLSFAYRMIPTYGGQAQFYGGIVTPDGPLTEQMMTPVVTTDTGIQQARLDLSATEIRQLQAVHTAGQPVFVAFTLSQQPANAFKVYVDDVSLAVTGRWRTPALDGTIAFLGLNDAGYTQTVETIAPDGSDRQTLWTHPGEIDPKIFDLAWKPDGSALAFSHNYEALYSPFHADIFSIQPDGSGVQRITHAPSVAQLRDKDYATGTITGAIHNNYGSGITPFLVYIEGATDAASVPLGDYDEQVSFTIENVADLGAGVSQAVVFNWSDLDCAFGKEFAAAVVDVLPGETVDIGPLNFNGHCYTYNVTALSWSRDGESILFTLDGAPGVVEVASGAIETGILGDQALIFDVAASPVDGRVLYRMFAGLDAGGIFLADSHASSGTQLVADTGLFAESPVWLPDGSGFIFTQGNNIFQYDFAAAQAFPLTDLYNEFAQYPSLSPDGQYIVFERASYLVEPVYSELWVMSRANPVEMWPLIADATRPDWGP